MIDHRPGTYIASRLAAGEAIAAGSGSRGTGIAGVRLSLLRTFDFARGGRSVRLPMGCQRLLALLAVEQHPVHRLRVAGVLWTDTSEQRSLANLRSALWRLRGPGPDLVECTGPSLRLAPSVSVDLYESADLARRLVGQADLVRDEELDSVSLSADLLPDWYDDWVLHERQRFRQLRIRALEALAVRYAKAERFAEAVEACQSAVAAEPLRESAYRILIQVHLAEGNAGEAIRHYRDFQKLLVGELGLDPSHQIRALMTGLPID